MSGRSTAHFFLRFKYPITFVLLALVAFFAFFSLRTSTRRKTDSKKSFSLSSLTADLLPSEFEPTEKRTFGKDGVHYFSNLFYKSHHFFIAQNTKTPSNELHAFLGQGKYAYDTRPLDSHQYSQQTKSKEAYKIPGATLILASSEEMKNLQHHYFHFLEEFILGWSAYKHFGTQPLSTVIFPDIDQWEGVNQLNFQILQAAIPNVRVLNKSQFQALSEKHLIQFEEAVLVDRQGCHNLEPVCTYNKMARGHMDLIKRDYLREIRGAVLSHLKTYDKPHRKPTITYIKRKNRRYLEKEFEAKLLKTLALEFPDHKIQPIWFEKLTYAEQLQIIRNTDILIGAHGNGLTHSYFLPDKALVLEIFPKGAFAMDYQMISELSGHDYYAIEPIEGIISYAGHPMPPRGNVNQIIEEFDTDWIIDPIKKHLQQEDEADFEKERSFNEKPLINE